MFDDNICNPIALSEKILRVRIRPVQTVRAIHEMNVIHSCRIMLNSEILMNMSCNVRSAANQFTAVACCQDG